MHSKSLQKNVSLIRAAAAATATATATAKATAQQQ
jgi:hypothetical protein